MPGTQKKAESKTPHFLSLNQDIVVLSQEWKCGLKYVMQSFNVDYDTLSPSIPDI
jgi:hypothetical protein